MDSEFLVWSHSFSTSFLHTRLYAGKWNVFEIQWLSKELDPFKATVPQIANFLLYLFYERKLSSKSIESYKTAILRPIRLSTGLDVSHVKT